LVQGLGTTTKEGLQAGKVAREGARVKKKRENVDARMDAQVNTAIRKKRKTSVTAIPLRAQAETKTP
jgi:hypothetical protein